MKDNLGIKSGFPAKISRVPARLQRIPGIKRTERLGSQIRDELHIPPGRDILESCDLCLLIQKSGLARRYSRPVVVFVSPRVVAGYGHTPAVHAIWMKPQAAEGNRNPDHEAFIG